MTLSTYTSYTGSDAYAYRAGLKVSGTTSCYRRTGGTTTYLSGLPSFTDVALYGSTTSASNSVSGVASATPIEACYMTLTYTETKYQSTRPRRYVPGSGEGTSSDEDRIRLPINAYIYRNN